MDNTPSPAIGSRRGRQMRQSQTPMKNQPTRPRPPPPEHLNEDPSMDRGTPLKPQGSKSSLKNLFMRAKSTRLSIYNNDSTTLPAIVEAQKPTAHISTYELNPSPTIVVPSPTKRFLANESPLSTNTSPKLPKTPKDKIHRTTSWNPPPLFKAYPQALTHATLPSPTNSADSILRNNAHQRIGSGRINAAEITAGRRIKDERKGIHHSRRTSEAFGKIEWTRKIYVLVTNGFLLQYSGDGNFDRLPEKMLELEKNSVAFASDAIPGKHWVLQISQTLDDRRSVALDSKRNFLTRLGFSDSRRATKSMLLVLNNAEELASWLKLVRREIDALGGKEYIPETSFAEKPETPYRSQPLNSKETRQKSSNGDLTDELQHSVSVANHAQIPPARPRADDSLTKQINRRSVRQSVESSSLSTVTTSTDLDRLRDASRFSYVSAGTRTIPSSRASSPAPSPAGSKTPASRNSCIESARTVKSERDSMVGVCSPTQPEDESESASIPPSLVTRQASPPPPNFSFPMQNKRCSGSLNSMMHSSTRENCKSPPPPPRPAPPFNPKNDNMGTRFASSPDYSSLVGKGNTDNLRRTESYRSTHPGVYYRPQRPKAEEISLSISPTSSQPKVKQSGPRRYSSYENTRTGKSSVPVFRPDLSTLRDDSSEDEVEAPTEPSPRESRIVPPRRPHSFQTHPRHHSKSTPSEGLSGASSQNNAYTGPSGDHLLTLEEDVLGSLSTRDTLGHCPKRRHSAKAIPSGKSMSHLSLGPPVAPPPDCPLPEVPPIMVSQFTPPRSRDSGFRSHRHSHQSLKRGSADVSIRESRRHTGTYFEYDCKDRLPTPAEINAKKASMVNAF